MQAVTEGTEKTNHGGTKITESSWWSDDSVRFVSPR